MIERKIHYCWFGGRPLPLQAKRCLASWAYYLPDYKVVRWDEQSFDVHSHPFTAAAYAAGRYAFVADYVRMLVLQRHGGIYLDVDVEMCGRFDGLLEQRFFIGLEDSKRFATSVIGAVAGHWLPAHMLEFYDSAVFDDGRLAELVNVNEVSRALLARGFSGEGGCEVIDRDQVLPVGVFSAARRGTAGQSKPIARHLYAGSWRSRDKKGLLSNSWRWLRKLPEQISAVVHLFAYRMGRVLQKNKIV
ncbi:glycosyltransferase family 32 protein [Pseudomonas zhanjiangensis]|uniref:Glycosyltransferase family 32 protein n=1 Tax=Pseudomonas zhanjiangensis TaxID=3239015 RepID=A0ABV3YQQ8_9PSED